MKRASIRVQEPTPELIEKIRRARVAISQQKPRYLKCPYCQHNAIAVYEDTRGHVEAKCKKCGRVTVFGSQAHFQAVHGRARPDADCKALAGGKGT